MLREEIEFYNKHLMEWLGQFPGKVALVKGEVLIGIYDTEDQALSEGTRQFGLAPFLMRRIMPQQEQLKAPALVLGIPLTNAHTEFADYRSDECPR